MTTIKLTDSEIWSLINACRVAQKQYAIDAMTHVDVPRLERQFKDQENVIRALANKLESEA